MEKKKILVIDDEVEFLDLMKTRLEANGYAVETAVTGPDGLDKLRREKIDAVLLDILMPGIDGIDVLKRIRRDNKTLPVFIITAFSNEERFNIANKYNASGFILKTNDLQTEIENITGALNVAGKFKAGHPS